MTDTPEAHVQLARRVATTMDAFARTRRLESVAAGSALPRDPPELVAGLICGFARAYRRLGGHERQLVPKAVRELASTTPEYAHAVDRLMSELGDEVIAAWSDFAEAVVEAAERSEDPTAAMLEFAALIRMHGLLDDVDAIDVGPARPLAHPHARPTPALSPDR